MRVPIIFWGAKSILKDWRVNSLVRTIDIAPTILELLDLPPMKEVQGRSLMPLMTGDSTDLQLSGYGESMELHYMFGSSILRCIRQGSWKYIHKLRPELYDLVRDPGELNDLASLHPEKVEELFQALRDEIRNAPARPDDAKTAIDEETLRQLQALGYAAADPSANSGDELASLESNGPDPADLFADVFEYSIGLEYSFLAKYAEAISIFEGLSRRHPRSLSILTTLAAAYAEASDFESAMKISRRAVGLARKQKMPERVVDALERNLESFRRGKPARVE